MGGVQRSGRQPLGQGLAALAGGVAGGRLVPRAAGALGDAAKRMIPMKPQDVDLQISAIPNRAGVDYSGCPRPCASPCGLNLRTHSKPGKN